MRKQRISKVYLYGIWCMVSCLIYYRSIYGHIDFLGKGATTLLEDVCGPVPRCLCIDTYVTP